MELLPKGTPIELRTLRYFLAVAREGSITAAAEAAHVTQPSLSRQIAQLEAELGVPLVERGRHGAQLTPEGQLLRARAETLVELADKAEAEVRAAAGELAGAVHVGCGDLAALGTLSQLIAAFSGEYPQVRFELTVVTASQARDRMLAGLDDLGVLLGEPDPARYEYLRLPKPERWVALVRADDELAESASVSAAELAKRTLVVPPGFPERGELAAWFGKRAGRVRMAATSSLNAGGAELVRAGAGVALVIEGSLAHAPEDLVAVPLKPALTSSAALAWPRATPLTEPVARFIAFAEERLGDGAASA